MSPSRLAKAAWRQTVLLGTYTARRQAIKSPAQEESTLSTALKQAIGRQEAISVDTRKRRRDLALMGGSHTSPRRRDVTSDNGHSVWSARSRSGYSGSCCAASPDTALRRSDASCSQPTLPF